MKISDKFFKALLTGELHKARDLIKPAYDLIKAMSQQTEGPIKSEQGTFDDNDIKSDLWCGINLLEDIIEGLDDHD